jgi:hypothetical protein
MSCPKYELVAGLEGADDILFQGAIIRIHEISFDEPEVAGDPCVMNLNYTHIGGDDIIPDQEFKNALGEIAIDVMEKHLAIKEIKDIVTERPRG